MAYKRVLFCYLSEAAHTPRCIIDYLNMGWCYGSLLDHYSTHENIRPLHHLAERVAREWHRMMELIRFRLAPIKPDNNVLPLLSPHFAERMAQESWIIHDTGRNTASRYFKGEWDIVDFEIIDTIEYGTEKIKDCRNSSYRGVIGSIWWSVSLIEIE